MKLMHYLFSGPIDFNNVLLQQLVFENPKDYGAMVKELYNQIQKGVGRFTLYDKDKELNLAKEVLFIESMINLERYDKQILQGLFAKLLDVLNGPDHQEEVYHLLSNLELIISDSLEDLSDCVSDTGIGIGDLLKSIEPRLNHCDNICSDLIQLCKLASEYMNKQLIVICNPYQYIDIEERTEFMRSLAYINTPILVIDRIYAQEYPCKLFDNDFCEIDLKNGDAYIFDV